MLLCLGGLWGVTASDGAVEAATALLAAGTAVWVVVVLAAVSLASGRVLVGGQGVASWDLLSYSLTLTSVKV